MSSKLTPVLVVVSNNGVVEDVLICKDAKDLEDAFRQETFDRGGELVDANIKNGYVELSDATICMTWASERPVEGSKRILIVRVTQLPEDDSRLDPEDVGIEGDYQVEIISSGHNGIDAGRALDELHETVAISCLDDFAMDVFDGDKELIEAADYENYSYKGGGAVKKEG